VKHLRGLAHCVEEGFDAYAVFVIQMRGVEHFEPAWDKHREFGLALQEAEEAGVRLIAVDCNVGPDSLEIAESVSISLVSP